MYVSHLEKMRLLCEAKPVMFYDLVIAAEFRLLYHFKWHTLKTTRPKIHYGQNVNQTKKKYYLVLMETFTLKSLQPFGKYL